MHQKRNKAVKIAEGRLLHKFLMAEAEETI